MKRIGFLWEKFIDRDNIKLAIKEVNKTHRSKFGKPNKVVLWVETNLEECVNNLIGIVSDENFKPSPTKHKTIWDNSAMKYREIDEPPLWPDQYIHHMLIQVLQPIMMRGMDYWCCASIKGRGTKRGIRGIKRWMRNEEETKYAAELDIYHFYDSLKQNVVIKRMKKLIKDKKILAFIKKLTFDGIKIGAYFSQWFANTVLQELDVFIRQQLHIKYYIRYMDNLTLFSNNKTKLHYALNKIKSQLKSYFLEIKNNWQIYPTNKRLVCGLGYRYGHHYSILRKRSLFKLKRHIRLILRRQRRNLWIGFRVAAGLVSRVAQLKWCNSKNFRDKMPNGLILKMRNIVSESRRRLNVRIHFQSLLV